MQFVAQQILSAQFTRGTNGRASTARARPRLLSQLVVALDVAAILLGFYAAHAIRNADFFAARYGRLDPTSAYLWLLWVIVPTWLWLLRRHGLHDSNCFAAPWSILRNLLVVQLIGGLTLLSAAFLLGRLQVSRLFTETFLATSFAILASEKLCILPIFKYMSGRRRDFARLRVLVVAVGKHGWAESALTRVRGHPYWTAEIVGREPLYVSGADGEHEPASTLAELVRWRGILNRYLVDEIVVATAWRDADRTLGLAQACSERGVTLRIIVNPPPAPVGRYYLEDLGAGDYLLSLETIPLRTPALVLKRLSDIAGSIVGMLLCGLAYLFYARKIRRESAGPVFFSQSRLGQNGRVFTLYKFRTMYADAERGLPDLLKSNEMRGCMFKLKNDPRVTPLGRVLRRRHLDELPQFWNVLKGEMSLIGTRPPTPGEVAMYLPHHHRRLSMKPGLTGLWQLNGNEHVNDFEDVVRLDCAYIDNWSLWLDWQILCKTALKVLRGDAS
jgi:exopolysaccharide biosynthesis polyprenyl glycosylphosphotransferase